MSFIENSWKDTDPAIRDILLKRLESGNDHAFFAFNEDDVKQKLTFWNEHFPRVKPFFAMKANHSDVAIRTMANLGTGFDCASKIEMKSILDLGVHPDRIIYAHPAKQLSHLVFAKENGIAKMTFDNVDELKKINSSYPAAKLVLRIRFDAKEASLKFGIKFGCDPNREARDLIKACQELKMNLIGISFHGGNDLEEPEVFENAIHAIKKLFDYAATIDMKLSFIDVGGGFSGVDMERVKKCAFYLNRAISECFPDPSVEIISEPGMFFVMTSMKVVCQAHSRKVERNKDGSIATINYYLNEGLYTSFLGCTIYERRVYCTFFHGDSVSQSTASEYDSVFWGQTCDSTDRMFEQKLPELQVGDWVIFNYDVYLGSYGYCRATNFNGFPRPDAISIQSSNVSKKSGGNKDMVW